MVSETLEAVTLPIRGQFSNDAFGALNEEEDAKPDGVCVNGVRSLESSRTKHVKMPGLQAVVVSSSNRLGR